MLTCEFEDGVDPFKLSKLKMKEMQSHTGMNIFLYRDVSRLKIERTRKQ